MPMVEAGETLRDAAAGIAADLKAALGDRRMPAARVREVAAQTILVSGGVRSAALIDALALSPPQCKALAQAVEPLCVSVVVYVPARQVFLVNERARRAGHSAQPHYVCADAPPTIIPRPPCIDAFARALTSGGSCIFIDAPNARACGVAVCGWLLEYPYVYVLDAENAPQFTLVDPPAWVDDWDGTPNALGHVPLCGLTVTLGPLQVLSCTFPCTLADACARLDSSVHAVHNMLVARLAAEQLALSSLSPALQRALAQLSPSVARFHTVHDRVAL